MKYGYVVYDRDGGIIASSADDTYDVYDTAEEADKAAQFHIDDPRYGSHEVEELDDDA